MIPRTIHYCWFGKGPKSDLNKKCLESWHRILPDYQIKEWNETNTPLDGAYCQTAYSRGLWSRLTNHVRLHTLYSEGGIYLDTDVEAIKSLDPLLTNKCFLGFEDTEWVNTAVLGSEPGHPFIKRCLAFTSALFEETGEFFRSPEVTTMMLRNMGLLDYGLQQLNNVMLFPAEYFYPYRWFGKFSPECVKDNTYCI